VSGAHPIEPLKGFFHRSVGWNYRCQFQLEADTPDSLNISVEFPGSRIKRTQQALEVCIGF
jgi:hypothetical protein